MESVESIVVGAGAVGLAVARRLAQSGREVLILEREAGIAAGTSSRNSEVIHAGIYYPPGSLKARLCVAGKHALYAYCADHGVPHRRIEKLIVATCEEEVAALKPLAERARANGVDDLEWLDGPAARRLEPAARIAAALRSPSTGILDSHAYMLALQGDAEAAGAMLATHSPIEAVRAEPGGFLVEVGGAEPMTLRCRALVNAAGLLAPALARRIEGLAPRFVPRCWIAKGNYFGLAGKAPFTRLIYPVPTPGGLGIHLTLDLVGRARFGPDVEWLESDDPDAVDYAVDPARAESFYQAVRRYWPDLPDGALTPDFAGARPKLSPKGAPAADFAIQGPAEHGLAGLVNLFGIESPGLTSSLAIAEAVAECLGDESGQARLSRYQA